MSLPKSMGGHEKRSKRQSDGKDDSPPSALVLYLDENLCDCRPIQEVLEKHGIKYERHLARFARGVPDSEWHPLVGAEQWVVLGKDKSFRYNALEKLSLSANRIRSFEFAKGTLNKHEMAAALEIGLPEILSMLKRIEAPFVASITKSGSVTLKWDARGGVSERREKKRKRKQRVNADSIEPVVTTWVDVATLSVSVGALPPHLEHLFCPQVHHVGVAVVMMPQANGSRRCGRCGHSYMPGNPLYNCPCIACRS